MGSIVASTIIDKAAFVLTDTANTRWTRAELLLWISEAQRQIISIKPDASNTITTVNLVQGSRQPLPTDGWQLLKVVKNMIGTAAGKVIRPTTRDQLDTMDSNWHATTQTKTVTNYIYESMDQTSFYVYPPNDGTGQAEINYSKIYGNLANENATINVLDIYEPAIVNYVLYRAFSKDAEFGPASAEAQAYLNAFLSGVKAQEAVEYVYNPTPDKP